MRSATQRKALVQLGLCLLLTSHMLLWSTAWTAPSCQESQAEQWGDSSPPFLVRSGENSPGDIPLAYGERQEFNAPIFAALKPERIRSTPTRRIRIASFPVLPQAPPALT